MFVIDRMMKFFEIFYIGSLFYLLRTVFVMFVDLDISIFLGYLDF